MDRLNIYTGNSMEVLAEQLAGTVRKPLSSPIDPEIVVVQSGGMARWVSLELARHNGICANCFFPFPNRFLSEIFKKLIPDLPEESPFDPMTMTFKIMKMLPACVRLPGFTSLKRYLLDDTNGIKLFQLSQRIADLFDQYLVFRSDMIFRWESGEENHWQAQLWRKLSSKEKHRHRAGLRKIFFERIRKAPVQKEDFPERVSIFGISYLPPFYLEVFVELSRRCPVNFFLMNPCSAYWADIVSDRELKKIKKKYNPSAEIQKDLYLEEGNKLLASMGILGRNFFSLINELDGRTVEMFVENDGKTLLSKIQSDILKLKNRKFSGSHDGFDPLNEGSSLPSRHLDSSIQIHSCHSPLREIEVLHDNILDMFEKDPDLLPKDIVVMAPDIEWYAPFIEAVFDGQMDEKLRIPFTIADQTLMKKSRVVHAFMSIIDLKNTRFSTACVMELLQIPEIKNQFKINESEIEIIERWIKETNIRWGIDAQYRRKKGLTGFSQNTWKAGLDRLFLGIAMPGSGRRVFSGILPYDAIEGSDVKILGKWMAFLDAVFECSETLDQARTLSGWRIYFSEILDRFFAPDEDSEQEMQVLRHILAKMPQKEEMSGFDTVLDIDVMRTYLTHCLEHEQFRSGFISGGVTFCAMLPMRSIPFKVVCLVGMNSESFPRETQSLGFDLMMKNPRIGDRSRRNDDKYLFLEALLSAGNIFYISYVGQSNRDNTRIPPSVLVSELMDYMKEGFGFSEDRLVTVHRLQAFSTEYFKKDHHLFSYSRENFSAAARMQSSRAVAPFISAKLSEPCLEWKHIDIKALSAFFSHPARFFLERRLGIYLSEKEYMFNERENFNLDPLEKYKMDQDLVTQKMSGIDLTDYFSVKKASGELPFGNVGKCIYNETSLDAEEFVRKIKDHVKGKPLDDLDVDFKLDGFHLEGRIKDVYEQGRIDIQCVKLKTKYILKTWIYHLILCALVEDKKHAQSLLLCKDKACEFKQVSDAQDRIHHLLQLYWKGMSEPLHFFPESSFEYMRKILLKNQTRPEALNSAKKKWDGSDFTRGESEEPYFELCFGKTDPLDEAFENLAKEIFTPLLKHYTETRL